MSIKQELQQLRGTEQTVPEKASVPKEKPAYVQVKKDFPYKTAKKKERNTEQFIGKTAMGIGASILVFIAMIMFATVLLPLFGNAVKMFCMYLFSIAMIVVGEVVYCKGKTRYTILTGCGVGALFISIVATCVYFRYIGVIPLYILLTLWSFGVAYHLARNRSLVFIIVGQAGILTASILSYFGEMTEIEILMMLLFIMISESAFWINFFRKSHIIDMINSCGIALSVLTLNISTYFNSGHIHYPETPIQLMVMLAGFAVFLATSIHLIGYAKTVTQKVTSQIYALIMTFFVILLSYMVTVANPSLESWKMLPAIIFAAVIVFVCEKTKERKIETSIVECFQIFTLLTLIAVTFNGIVRFELFMFIFVVFAVYGITKKDLFFHIVSVITVMFGVCNTVFEQNAMICLAVGTALILIHMVLVKMTELDKKMFSYEMVSYLSLIASSMMLIFSIDWETFGMEHYAVNIAAVTVLTMIQLLSGKMGWAKSKTNVPSYVINCLVMASALNLFTLDMTAPYIVWSILVTAVLFSINITNLMKITPYAGAYIAFKYSVLITVIMYSLETPNLMVSVILLAIAATSVIAGFKFENKSVRLYGLVLSMISVAKLTLVDITYDNSLARAFSFLVCGLICFGISVFYNYMEKENRNE